MLIITQWEIVTVLIQLVTTVAKIPATTEATLSTLTITDSLSTSLPSSTLLIATSSADDTFSSIMLTTHNKLREMHNAQELSWNDTLYQYAHDYASRYSCSGKLVHSGGPYGENLALGYTLNGSVNAWYSEGETYDYQTHNLWDHFTQVVWNDTSQLGCAYKYCNSVWGKYIICSYYPPGNIVGGNQQNVFSLL